MELEQLLASMPRHLKVAAHDVQLSPELGFLPARFETLLDLERWLPTEAANAYRRPAAEPITLDNLIRHCGRISGSVIMLMRDSIRI